MAKIIIEKKKNLSFTFSIVAIILGITLLKNFDFAHGRFEKTGLAIVYLITFTVSVFVLARKIKNREQQIIKFVP